MSVATRINAMKMTRNNDAPLSAANEARRLFLLRALSMGVLAGGAGWNLPALASLFGKLPGKLPEGKSIFELSGEVTVNGARASAATLIKPGDSVKTGSNSYAIYAVGSNAFILRENSTFDIGVVGKALKQTMRLLTGKLLGVFGRRDPSQRLSLRTGNATIGIRGTGVYAEADAEKTYLCTCYGTTDLVASSDFDLDAPAADPASRGKNASVAPPPERAEISAQHHDAPKYILSNPEKGKLIVPAPFLNHTDLELMTLEALVGRKVPFGLQPDQYEAPRREY